MNIIYEQWTVCNNDFCAVTKKIQELNEETKNCEENLNVNKNQSHTDEKNLNKSFEIYFKWRWFRDTSANLSRYLGSFIRQQCNL